MLIAETFIMEPPGYRLVFYKENTFKEIIKIYDKNQDQIYKNSHS